MKRNALRASFLDEKQEIKNFGTDSKKDVDKQKKKIYNQDIKEMEPIPKRKTLRGEVTGEKEDLIWIMQKLQLR